MTQVPEDLTQRGDVETGDLVPFYETAALYYGYGRFDAGDETLFDEELEEFALAYARSCTTSGYTPIRRFYDEYLRSRR